MDEYVSYKVVEVGDDDEPSGLSETLRFPLHNVPQINSLLEFPSHGVFIIKVKGYTIVEDELNTALPILYVKKVRALDG